MSPAKRRRTVERVVVDLHVPERRVCRALGQPRSTQRYSIRLAGDEPRLVQDIVRLATLSLIFPRLMVDALLFVLLTLLTGALHLDGFADTVDALAGGRTREERLAILADSRIGAVGAGGLILLLLVKFAAIHSCPESLRDRALFLFPAMGRWSMVLLAWKGTYARDAGTGKAFVGNVRWTGVLVATLTVAGATVLLLRFLGLVIPAAMAFLGLLSFFYFRRRFGGITGDLLGALNEISELFTLVMFSLNV